MLVILHFRFNIRLSSVVRNSSLYPALLILASLHVCTFAIVSVLWHCHRKYDGVLSLVWGKGVNPGGCRSRHHRFWEGGSWNIIMSYYVQEVCSKVATFEEK